jgi:hypothetical protein
MADELPVQKSGKWTLHLQPGQNLQLHITLEQGTSGQVIIEGHDISVLLDYLYDNRELIYEATHDQELRRLEALDAPFAVEVGERQIERYYYFDDGMERIKSDR